MEKEIYLSTANQSRLPDEICRSLHARREEYERNPTRGMALAWGRLWEAQGALARHLRARPEDLIFRTSATSILNTLLLGWSLPEGAEILFGELEYGAVVNILKLRAAREKVQLRVLKIPSTPFALRALTEDALVEHVLSQISPRTRMLVLSHAIGSNNLVLPVARIARETRARGVFFIVDGTHALGSIPGVDMETLGDVDAYAAGLYKWFLGPKGTSFGWVPERNHDRLRPIEAGWTTFEGFGPLSAFGAGSRFQEAFLMHGCFDFIPFLALPDVVALWKDPESRYRRREALRRRLRAALPAAPLEAGDPALQGPMLVYRSDANWDEIRIQTTSVTLHGTRYVVLSPHVSNHESEIDEAASRIHSTPLILKPY